MQELQVVEYSNTRVLFTTQLAEAFDTNSKVIMRNFQRNRERYVPNVHYYALAGDDLKRFKELRQNDVSLKYVSILYLWTEQGAWLHAKSLSTDKSWSAYQALVNSYYTIVSKKQEKNGNNKMTLALTMQEWEQVQQRLEVLEMHVKDSTLHSGEQRRLRSAVGERVNQLAKVKSAQPVLFRALYSAIRERYEVGSYRDVRQCDLQDALRYVIDWKG